jgi:CheY-like chemotaxis protein
MTIKLLVADDSVTMQKVVRLAFGDEDVEIESVLSGDASMDSVHAFKPDIVLADVIMPGCSGYELCERIKDDPELSDTPVILLVGTFEPFDEAEASRVRCDGHLTKPFDTSELINKVLSLAKGKESMPTVKTSVSLGETRIYSRVQKSFLGSERILDVFDPEIFALAEASLRQGDPANEIISEVVSGIAATPALKDFPSEEFVNSVADKVVRQMSPDIIREVAWEVVPELSEILIRRVIEEQRKS